MSEPNSENQSTPWSRRDFSRCGACVVGATCVGLLVASRSTASRLQEPLSIHLGDPIYANLRSVGGAVKIDVEGQDLPVMLVRLDEGNIIALSTYCTHWGCEVELPGEDGLIHCRCHGARYDRQGRLIDGPALDDLEQIPVEVTFPTPVLSNSWAQLKKMDLR